VYCLLRSSASYPNTVSESDLRQPQTDTIVGDDAIGSSPKLAGSPYS